MALRAGRAAAAALEFRAGAGLSGGLAGTARAPSVEEGPESRTGLEGRLTLSVLFGSLALGPAGASSR